MRLPRDVSGRALARALEGTYGSVVTRQAGSHLRLTTAQQGQHHVTIPDHATLRLGTLAAILSEVVIHLGVDREVVAQQLFGA